MTDRELMQQALEALEWCQRRYEGFGPEFIPLTITSLRERLAHPEQEPVAWLSHDGNVLFGSGPKGKYTQALYTTPLRREWRGLTEEELDEAMEYWSEDGRSAYGGAFSADGEYVDMKDTWRYIEAKLREKNG